MDRYTPRAVHGRDDSTSSDSVPIWAIILSACLSFVLISVIAAVFCILHRRKSRRSTLSQDRIMGWLRRKSPPCTYSETSSKIPYNDVELAAGVEPLQVMRLQLAGNRVHELPVQELTSCGFSAATTTRPPPRNRLSDIEVGHLISRTAKDFRSILNMLKDTPVIQFPSCEGQESRNSMERRRQPNVTRQEPAFPALAFSKDIWVERIMSGFWAVFDRRWTAKVNTYTGSSRNTGNASKYTRSASTSTTTLSSINTLASSSTGRKRSRASDDDLPSDDEDGPPRRLRSQTRFPKGLEDELKLACPFRKHDPVKYSLHDFPVCALSSWDTIARLKEHLLRSHSAPLHCKRCWVQFKSQEALDAHLTVPAVEICKLQDGRTPDGITPQIAVKLRSRKKSSPDQSVPERWKDIYRLLFPDELVPMPYFERIQDSAVASPESPSFEDFMRRELPCIFRSHLDRTVHSRLQSLDTDLKGELVNIIRNCQEQLSRDYRAKFGVNRAEATTNAGSSSMPPSGAQQSPLENQNYSLLPGQEDASAAWMYLTPLASGLPPQVESTFDSQTYVAHNEPPSYSFAQHSDLTSSFVNVLSCSCVGPCNCYLTTSTNTPHTPSLNFEGMDLSESRRSIGDGARGIRNIGPDEFSTGMSWLDDIFK